MLAPVFPASEVRFFLS